MLPRRFAASFVLLPIPILAVLAGCATSDARRGSEVSAATNDAATIAERVADLRTLDGFLRLHVDDEQGTVLLELPAPSEEGAAPTVAGARPLDAGTRLEAIHVSGIRTGLGSNPVGLDRGQLGATRVVRFRDVGGRVLLEQVNLAYRATSDDAAERAAVAESFAGSVLWSGPVEVRDPDGRVLVDVTSFLRSDLHRIARTLEDAGEGRFSLDAERSVVDTRATLAFPDNCELEAVLTFASSDPGRRVRETAAEATAPSFVLHHSFVRLPDDGYRPRAFDVRTGSFGVFFLDYAADLDEPIRRGYIARHRLEQVEPGVAGSPVVEPIVFHVDRGAPEPIRSALVEGARWWAEAFERAGFPGGYRVELLPEDAHPMDVRYHVIQWVHRSTRGWSYGASVTDPRTGEILKGHVSLGSLRLRQDRLLFEGLAGTAATGTGAPDDPVELALARIRQLAAHEVGHALGFAHNFAASTQDRASVMDYPAPLIRLEGDRLDFSRAYDTGIGAWDVHAVNRAYRAFPPGTDEAAALERIVREAEERGLRFLSDADARGTSAAHPYASLWDNGADPVAELRETMAVRRHAIDAFTANRVADGRPVAHLQEVFVPVYLHHRYQVEAAAKLLGGVDYAHALVEEGAATRTAEPVAGARQRAALEALLDTLEPAFLDVPEPVVRLLVPRPFGEGGNRELFPSRTGPTFDPLAAASAATAVTLGALLDHARLARVAEQPRRADNAPPGRELPGLEELFTALLARTFPRRDDAAAARHAGLRRGVQRQLVQGLVELAQHGRAAPDVRAQANAALAAIAEDAVVGAAGSTDWHAAELRSLIVRHLDRPFGEAPPLRATEPTPPGSPIGMVGGGGHALVPPGHLCGCGGG